jgi:hypothetical protein
MFFQHGFKKKQSYVNADVMTNLSCPRCSEPEDASHMWKCLQSQVQAVWAISFSKLDIWMSEVGTLPAVKESI